MKLIFPYDNDNIYTGTPVELYPDSETGDYVMPPNGAGFPPEINGEGMWRPFFDEEKQEWVETADEAYKESLKKDTAPDSNQLAGLGGQLANEKLARKADRTSAAVTRQAISVFKTGTLKRKRRMKKMKKLNFWVYALFYEWASTEMVKQAMGYDDCSAEDLAEGVAAKYITPEEFQEITGETYENYKNAVS